MMSDEKRKRLSEAYKVLHQQLIMILYEEDPDQMGSTVGAPPDEYSDTARELITRLKGVRDRPGVFRVLSELYPHVNEKTVTRVYLRWTDFLRETADSSEGE